MPMFMTTGEELNKLEARMNELGFFIVLGLDREFVKSECNNFMMSDEVADAISSRAAVDLACEDMDTVPISDRVRENAGPYWKDWRYVR